MLKKIPLRMRWVCSLIIITIIIFIIIIIIIIIQIGKRQLHFIRLNHVLFDLNKLSKYTAYTIFFCKTDCK